MDPGGWRIPSCDCAILLSSIHALSVSGTVWLLFPDSAVLLLCYSVDFNVFQQYDLLYASGQRTYASRMRAMTRSIIQELCIWDITSKILCLPVGDSVPSKPGLHFDEVNTTTHILRTEFRLELSPISDRDHHDPPSTWQG